MKITISALSCALLAISLSKLPTSDGAACTAPDTPTGCTDCTLAANVAAADCVTTTTVAATADTTTTAATTADTTTTTAASTDTTTAAASACGTKTRRKRKWKVVRKPGKKIIKRHHKGGKKEIFGKSINTKSGRGRKGGRGTRRRRSG